jgi:hypothetical protein
MKRLAVIVLLVALGPACASRVAVAPRGPQLRAASPAADPEIVLDLPTGLESPSATLRFGDTNQQANLGSSCWTRPAGGDNGVVTCADASGEYDLVTSWIEVPGGTVLRVDGTPEEISGRLGTVTDHGNHDVQFDTVQELSLSDGHDVITAEPGDYTLDLFVRWDHGDSALAFGIRVV